MDKNIAIEFQGVGKQYRLGRVGTGTLQHDLNRFWQTTILGKEDPYLKIGEVNDRSQKAHSDYVWALKDINFKVEQGDVVGIIGKNGAGKSTLLKLLSHITAPSTGDIYYRGRIASLLEVGTGFHGELTGKENIYMNGAVLGMTKQEIKRKGANDSDLLRDLYKLNCFLNEEVFWKKTFDYGVFILEGKKASLDDLKIKPGTTAQFKDKEISIDSYLEDEKKKGKFPRILCVSYDGININYETLDNLANSIIKDK